MTYELAKQLKDAGFPNLQWMNYLTQFGIATFEKDHHSTPILSELIEACGDEFESLTRWKDLPSRQPEFYFSACRVNPKSDDEEFCGDSPEIAVANLWLALNKK